MTKFSRRNRRISHGNFEGHVTFHFHRLSVLSLSQSHRLSDFQSFENTGNYTRLQLFHFQSFAFPLLNASNVSVLRFTNKVIFMEMVTTNTPILCESRSQYPRDWLPVAIFVVTQDRKGNGTKIWRLLLVFQKRSQFCSSDNRALKSLENGRQLWSKWSYNSPALCLLGLFEKRSYSSCHIDYKFQTLKFSIHTKISVT